MVQPELDSPVLPYLLVHLFTKFYKGGELCFFFFFFDKSGRKGELCLEALGIEICTMFYILFTWALHPHKLLGLQESSTKWGNRISFTCARVGKRFCWNCLALIMNAQHAVSALSNLVTFIGRPGKPKKKKKYHDLYYWTSLISNNNK